VITYHIPTGTEIVRAAMGFRGRRGYGRSGTLARDQVAFGFDDGTVRFATIGFEHPDHGPAQPALPMPSPLDGRDRIRRRDRVFTQVGTGDFRTFPRDRTGRERSRFPMHRSLPSTTASAARANGRPSGLRHGRCQRAGPGQPLARQVNMMTGAADGDTTTVEPAAAGTARGRHGHGILLSGRPTGPSSPPMTAWSIATTCAISRTRILAERRRVADPGVAVTP
jgi:phosphate transport system permease protein